MHETTIDITHGMAHAAAAAPAAVPMTIAQQLSQQAAAIDAARARQPSEALAGIAADCQAALEAHAALEAKRGPAILARGANAPGSSEALAAIRAELAKSEDYMRGLIEFAKTYLEQHAKQVADSRAQHFTQLSSAIVLRASALIDLAVKRGRLEAAYLDNLQQAAELGEGRWRDASTVLAERYAGDYHKLMDAGMVAAPRLRGFNSDTAQTFGRFVARAIRVMGNTPELTHAVRDPTLAYCEGPRDWDVIAADHAEHIALQFGGGTGKRASVPAVSTAALMADPSYSTANGVSIDDAGQTALQRWQAAQADLAPVKLVERRAPAGIEGDE